MRQIEADAVDVARLSIGKEQRHPFTDAGPAVENDARADDYFCHDLGTRIRVREDVSEEGRDDRSGVVGNVARRRQKGTSDPAAVPVLGQ